MDWLDSKEVVIQETSAIAVFDNGDRQVVILQRGLGGPETDLQIFVPFDRLGDFIKALQKQLPEE